PPCAYLLLSYSLSLVFYPNSSNLASVRAVVAPPKKQGSRVARRWTAAYADHLRARKPDHHLDHQGGAQGRATCTQADWTTVQDYSVWTLADGILSNLKTGRDESPSWVQISVVGGFDTSP